MSYFGDFCDSVSRSPDAKEKQTLRSQQKQVEIVNEKKKNVKNIEANHFGMKELFANAMVGRILREIKWIVA